MSYYFALICSDQSHYKEKWTGTEVQGSNCKGQGCSFSFKLPPICTFSNQLRLFLLLYRLLGFIQCPQCSKTKAVVLSCDFKVLLSPAIPNKAQMSGCDRQIQNTQHRLRPTGRWRQRRQKNGKKNGRQFGKRKKRQRQPEKQRKSRDNMLTERCFKNSLRSSR